MSADSVQIIQSLTNLKDTQSFSLAALEANIAGIRDGQWDHLGGLIARGEIFSDTGIGLIIAPYHVKRPGTKPKLSMLLCRKMNVEPFPIDLVQFELEYWRRGCAAYCAD